jgi:hypothetical protein
MLHDRIPTQPHFKFLFKSHKKVLKNKQKFKPGTNQSKFSKRKVNKSAKVINNGIFRLKHKMMWFFTCLCGLKVKVESLFVGVALKQNQRMFEWVNRGSV